MDLQSQRQKIAELIFGVLAERITVQDALKVFPQEITDESTECALHALIHYDADEDFRSKDIDYAEEQVDYLENIANILKNGEEIPINIIDEYRDYYESSPQKSKKGIINIIKSIFRLTI